MVSYGVCCSANLVSDNWCNIVINRVHKYGFTNRSHSYAIPVLYSIEILMRGNWQILSLCVCLSVCLCLSL